MKRFGKFSFHTMLLVLFLAFVVYLIFHSMKYEGMKARGAKNDDYQRGEGGPGPQKPQNPKWNSCQSQFNSCVRGGGSYSSCQPQRESCLQ